MNDEMRFASPTAVQRVAETYNLYLNDYGTVLVRDCDLAPKNYRKVASHTLGDPAIRTEEGCPATDTFLLEEFQTHYFDLEWSTRQRKLPSRSNPQSWNNVAMAIQHIAEYRAGEQANEEKYTAAVYEWVSEQFSK